MEGQFNKIKKFKGVLLALMVAVAASIPVTTGEFKDAYAAKIIPQNQRYERCYGYQGKQEYFFVSKGSSSPTVLRYTLTTATDGKVICSFEAYTEVTRNYQQNCPCRCWLWVENLELGIGKQNSAYASGAVCWHPNDEAINKVYEMIRNLNVVYQDAHECGLNFKAVDVSQGESVYRQDGYVVDGNFITSLLQQNARWPSDWSRLYKQPVCPAVNRNQYQQQLAENPNQGNQPRQQNHGHRQYQPSQDPVQQQFRQPAQPYNPNSIRQFLLQGINEPPKFEPPGERALYTCLRSKQFPNYYYYLTDVRGSGNFGTVYGATLLDPNGEPIVNRDGQPIKYCIEIIKSTHIKVKDDGNVDVSPLIVGDPERNKIAGDINREISMMKKMAGCRGTSQFIEVFNEKMQGGVPINVCIVQSVQSSHS